MYDRRITDFSIKHCCTVGADCGTRAPVRRHFLHGLVVSSLVEMKVFTQDTLQCPSATRATSVTSCFVTFFGLHLPWRASSLLVLEGEPASGNNTPPPSKP